MGQSAYILDEPRRAITTDAIRAFCADRGLHLFAVHVRTNHLHAVVEMKSDPKAVALDLKRYASRALNQSQLDYKDRKRWARGSSVRILPDRDAIDRAIHYVAANQGEPMALFVAGSQTSPHRQPQPNQSPGDPTQAHKIKTQDKFVIERGLALLSASTLTAQRPVLGILRSNVMTDSSSGRR